MGVGHKSITTSEQKSEASAYGGDSLLEQAVEVSVRPCLVSFQSHSRAASVKWREEALSSLRALHKVEESQAVICLL